MFVSGLFFFMFSRVEDVVKQSNCLQYTIIREVMEVMECVV